MIWFTLALAATTLVVVALRSGRRADPPDHAHAALWDYQRALSEAGRCLDATGTDICWAGVESARLRALPFVDRLTYDARSIVIHPDLPAVVGGDTLDAAHACLRLAELLCADLESVCPWVQAGSADLGPAADVMALRWGGGFSQAA